MCKLWKTGILLLANASEILNEIKFCHLKFLGYHLLQDSHGISVCCTVVCEKQFCFHRQCVVRTSCSGLFF